jgi:hypothetical protein
MATSEILGLFTTPQQYQQNQLAQFQNRAATEVQLNPFQQAALGARTAGYQLGQGVGSALGGQDPQLQLIAGRQRLTSQLDPNDPDSYMRVAKMAADAGDQQFAIAIADAGRKAMSEFALIQQRTRERQGADPFQQLLRAGKFTPESLAKYQETGNVADLRDIEKVKDDVVVVGNALVSKSTGKPIYEGEKPQKYSDFARKLIEAGLTPDTEPFQRRMLDYVNQETKGAGQGKGNVYLGGISVDTGVAAKAAAKVIGEGVANIESQFSLQTGISDALKLIDNGIYAGAYGPEKGFVAKYSLGTVGDPKKLENTEVFMANIGEIVIPRLQQFGGNDSNEELKYLQKVVAGDQRLEPASMRRILASAEKKIANNIARLQKQAESGKTGEGLPLQPMQTAPSQPKPTKRYNPQTKKLEVITGE